MRTSTIPGAIQVTLMFQPTSSRRSEPLKACTACSVCGNVRVEPSSPFLQETQAEKAFQRTRRAVDGPARVRLDTCDRSEIDDAV